MLRLEKANGKNVWELLKLRVSDDQKTFVASNDISIIEAYTAITGNGYAFPFGIYDEDTPVGFLMIGFDVDDYWTDAPAIAKGNYNLWRLMIDKAYQKKGYLMSRRMKLPGSCIVLLAFPKPEKWMERK